MPPIPGAAAEVGTKSPAPTATRKDRAPPTDPAEDANAELTKAKPDLVNVQECIRFMQSQQGMEDVIEQVRHRETLLINYITEITPKPPSTVMAQRLRKIEHKS